MTAFSIFPGCGVTFLIFCEAWNELWWLFSCDSFVPGCAISAEFGCKRWVCSILLLEAFMVFVGSALPLEFVFRLGPFKYLGAESLAVLKVWLCFVSPSPILNRFLVFDAVSNELPVCRFFIEKLLLTPLSFFENGTFDGLRRFFGELSYFELPPSLLEMARVRCFWNKEAPPPFAATGDFIAVGVGWPIESCPPELAPPEAPPPLVGLFMIIGFLRAMFCWLWLKALRINCG